MSVSIMMHSEVACDAWRLPAFRPASIFASSSSIAFLGKYEIEIASTTLKIQ